MSDLISKAEVINAIENHNKNVGGSSTGIIHEAYCLAHEHIIALIEILPTQEEKESV